MDNMIFFGTPEICLPFLELLYAHFKIALIVTQPDTMAGRNRKKRIVPAAKTFALEKNIDVLQPDSLKDTSLAEKLSRLEPFIGVVISYGKIIPGRIFRVPKYGTINVHFSLLPYYRGAAPVQRAIANNESKTGITIFEIAKAMDAGEIWARKETDIAPDDTTGSMWERMSREGAPFLIDTINKITSGEIQKYPQPHEKATYAPIVQKEEGAINWNLTAPQIYNRFRAFTPWPGIFFCAQEKSFRLTKIKVIEQSHDKKPGDVLLWDKKSLKVCCGKGTILEVFELQPQGKKPMAPYCYCMGNELPDCLV